MIEVVGKNGVCKIMTDQRDEEGISHLYRIMSAGVTEGSVVRVMADYHEGKGSVIGFTQRLNKENPKICPNVVGVDLGCRVSSVKLPKIHDLDFDRIDKWIRANIPLGAAGYLPSGLSEKQKSLIKKEDLIIFDDASKLIKEDGKDVISMKVSILNQLVSIGSGNHFVEIDQDEKGNYWLTLHCGSRNLGLTVANIYQKHAEDYCDERCEKEMKYLDKGSFFFDRYLTCVHACQVFSDVNHRILFYTIKDFLESEFSDKKTDGFEEYITTLHNYIDLENMIVRKGAISAQKGENILIPFNMKEGIAICAGKGNEDYNWSAPHGC